MVKRVGTCKLVVTKNKAKGKTYQKVVVNLPKKVLSAGVEAGEYTVFADKDTIILSKGESFAVRMELLQELIKLFTLAFNDTEIGPQLVSKFGMQVGVVVNLLRKIKEEEKEGGDGK